MKHTFAGVALAGVLLLVGCDQSTKAPTPQAECYSTDDSLVIHSRKDCPQLSEGAKKYVWDEKKQRYQDEKGFFFEKSGNCQKCNPFDAKP